METLLTPLHVRSGYSLLWGTAPPERLIARAQELGQTALAVTDVNGVYGATVFHQCAREAGLRPIIGAELQEAGHAAVALVASRRGYENLCRILTRIHRRLADADGSPGGAKEAGPDGAHRAAGTAPNGQPRGWPFSAVKSVGNASGRRIRRPEEQAPPGFIADLAELGEGLHVIVEDAALAAALAAVGASCWVGIDPATQGHCHLRRLSDCARELALPMVATGKALFAEAGDREVVRLLTAIRLGWRYDGVGREQLPPPRAVLRGPAELQRELAGFPAAAGNNRRLAEECAAFRLLPREPVFPRFAPPRGQTPAEYLRHLCREGLLRRYGRVSHTARQRAAEELALIRRKGLAEYFLVVWDIVRYARGRGAPVAGRGSGASSLVAYALGITNVCPLTYDIPFERFLNEQRADFPDLDVDFCWRIRDDVIDYAFRRWGADRVAMVSMHNTFQPRSAFRETAKAFGLSDEQISRFLREGPPAEGGSRKVRIPGLSDAASDHIFRLSGRIRELPRNLSVHPGGIIIAPKPIDHYVPVQRAAKGVMITQYDKDGVEAIGLVKLDLLGNRCLSTVRGACDMIRRRRGRAVDVEALPPADPATVAVLQAADTVGCNQLESPAMRHLLRMVRPAHVRDVMKALALIRPGAASIGMKEVFVRRHRRLEGVPTGHRQVDAVLRDTYGVMLYEDDVMLAAAAMGGVTPGEADPFRRAVQNCRGDEERRRLSEEFLSRCAAGGVRADYAKAMWVQMAKFNAYSFCRAHAASYAALAYAGAYLKTHYPLEFWTAALNNNQSMYPLRVYVEQAKRDGVRFLLPDANRSGEEFAVSGPGRPPAACLPQHGRDARVTGGAIRVGLGCIAGLGPVTVKSLLEARAGGAFASVTDAVARAALGAEEARLLILCGAFDFTSRPRPALMMELALALAKKARRRPTGRGRALLAPAPTLPRDVKDYTADRKYADEWRILGVSVREHPMARYRPRLNAAVDADSRRLAGRIGRRVRVAGLLEAQRTAPTQTGRIMRFLTLHDEYGLFEVTAFPGACHAYVVGKHGCTQRSHGTPCAGTDMAPMPALDRYGPYVVAGRVEDQYGSIAVSANSIRLCENES